MGKLNWPKGSEVVMRILNLYAGIGGNRKLWGNEHEITAVEIDPKIAKIYQDLFPKDIVIIADAHQYLLEHYKEFDFIWSSPPCPTHSSFKKIWMKIGKQKIVYPDMGLYQEILLLKHFFEGKYVVENVKGYYTPLILPQESGRHYFWANFKIEDKKFPKLDIRYGKTGGIAYGFDLNGKEYGDKRKLLRNCVDPDLGLHILSEAIKWKT
jgi:DNA (cytosine-5)-methyltransferase 1